MFEWLQSEGGIADHEMRRTFNCGVGFMLIVSPEQATPVLEAPDRRRRGRLRLRSTGRGLKQRRYETPSVERSSADDVRLLEELGDFDAGVFVAVGAVNRVLAQGQGEQLADRAFGGLRRDSWRP